MSLIWQEEIINFLAEHRKYRVLWWGFGSTLLVDLCKKKGFNDKELLENKSSEGIKEQCVMLLEALGEEKLYWWWPWSCKVKEAKIDKKQYQRAREYENYSWLWKIILGLFTLVLIHRRVLQWNDLVTDCYGGCMFKGKKNSEGKDQAQNINREVPTASSNISNNLNKDPDLMTLGDALKLFGLPKLLQELDSSLEEVRKHTKLERQHEQDLKVADKAIQKLSLKYHPDKVKGRNGSDQELAQAQKMQTILNTTRTVLNSLTKAFLENLDIDYKYGFYARMEMSSFGNEDEIKKLNLGVLHKLVMLSEIKQEKIIVRINKFLKASQDSIKSFIEGNVNDFEKNRNNSLLYLSMCIDGYTKLSAEFDEVKKEFKEDEALESMSSLINRMARESSRQLNTLRELEKFTEGSLKGGFQIFTTYEDTDEYFVLPFIKYINVLLMCSKVCNREKNESKESWQFLGLRKKIASWKLRQGEIPEQEPNLEQEEVLYGYAYYLASYFNDNSKYVKEVRKALGIIEGKEISIEKVINRFNEVIRMIKDNLEKEFKPDAYIEGGTKKYIMKEYTKWMKIMDDFLEKEEKRIKDTWVDIENSKVENKKLVEECGKVVEEDKRLRGKFDTAIEEIRGFRQKMSSYMKYGEADRNEANNQEASTSQQQPANQAYDQSGPSYKFDEVKSVSRGHSLYSDDSNINGSQNR